MATKFAPQHCQYCGKWIKRQPSKGRPRLFCNRRCHYARSVADERGMVSLKAGWDLIPVFSQAELLGRIYERAAHPGCAVWLLRLAEAVHRNTGNYLCFTEFLGWLDRDGGEIEVNERSLTYGGKTWQMYEDWKSSLVMRTQP